MRLAQQVSCPKDEETLLRYLLVKTSPVMMKAKPAVLIRISNCHHAGEFQPYDIFCSYQKTIFETLALDYAIMKNNGRDIQVLFYDTEVLENVLNNSAVMAFLEKLGYEGEWTTERCLDELGKRFRRGVFPHEIGIFLGYPLKDVLGFVSDYDTGAYVKRGLWRVYGDVGESLQTMNLYRRAEEFGKAVIEHCRDLSDCISRIKNVVKAEILIPEFSRGNLGRGQYYTASSFLLGCRSLDPIQKVSDYNEKWKNGERV